ncbi:MAG: LacI family DNA-binding transcriptional regulator [Lentisphaeria bacterium]|nr:LacI family DNA-binding transcriptional regulator [Lentisphaeria bacterium]
MVRCKDIAAMVGVSRQAVTAVLNNSRPNCVSKEKRAEILRVAAEHNYCPDHAAIALKTGKSNLIGIVMPPWDNPYIAELCMGIQRCLASHGFTPFFTIDNYENPVPGNLEQLLSLHVAGVITVAASILPDDIGLPVVSYYYDDPRFDSVCPNFREDSRLIIEHLAACGHTKIGYLGQLEDSRVPHLISEAEDRKLEFPERWRIDCRDMDYAALFDRLLERNGANDLPTALIVHNDNAALQVMRRIRERNFRIPEDISIIGHDDISYCGNALPALTSVSFGSPDANAEVMVGLLTEQIASLGRPRKKILLNSRLIRRESVLDLGRKNT